LWAGCPQQGSLFPVVPIVRELTARGHEVTAMADGAGADELAALGLPFLATKRRDDVGLQDITNPDMSVRQRWHEAYVRAWFADVTGALASARFDLVLDDPLEPGAGLAAEAAGVKAVSYAHWAIDHADADVFFTTWLWDRDGDAADAFVTFWNDQRRAVGLPPDPRPPSEHRWYRHSARLSLVLGLPELVHPAGDLPPYALRVGPSVWQPPRTEELPVATERRDASRPVVLASASTVGTADTRQLEAIVDAVRDDDVEMLLTIPNGSAPQGLPPNVTALPFVPHDEALLERVDYVISHSGLGTVTRVACAGKPMLLLPRKGDQFPAARGAVHAGVAVSLQPDEVSTGNVRAALATLRTDPSYRQRAAAIARTSRGYDAARAAADAIDALV
jgi:UDP:flavonoid glycosyltransferase YjiC (YdhE family)